MTNYKGLFLISSIVWFFVIFPARGQAKCVVSPIKSETGAEMCDNRIPSSSKMCIKEGKKPETRYEVSNGVKYPIKAVCICGGPVEHPYCGWTDVHFNMPEKFPNGYLKQDVN